MPDRPTQLEIDKRQAVMDLILGDGVTPRGIIPADHVEAVESLEDLDRGYLEDVKESHRQNKSPPTR